MLIVEHKPANAQLSAARLRVSIWMTDAEWVKVQSAPKKWVNGLVQRAKVPA